MTDIALFLPSLRGGGAERVMLTLANGFASAGLSVDLVVCSADGAFVREVQKNVRIVDLGLRRVSLSLPRLVRYFRRQRPRSMLSALNHANVIALLARRLAGVDTKMFVTEHSNLSLSVIRSKTLRQRVLLVLMRRMYRTANSIIAVSDGVADDLAKTLGILRKSVRVIYNPIVSAELKTLASAPLSDPWVADRQVPLVLAVGRLTEAKGFVTLVRAFAKVRERADCRLVILGEGELRRELESLVAKLEVSDSVRMPGFVDNPFAWMNRAHVFVLSSEWEGLPSVLIQAMASGAPVISTDCRSGPREILEDGRWGRLVPVSDVEALAQAIEESVSLPKARSVVERAEHFSVEKSIDEYLKIVVGESK